MTRVHQLLTYLELSFIWISFLLYLWVINLLWELPAWL